MALNKGFWDELQKRGLINQATDAEATRKQLSEGPVTLYCGFDPTADSLHVGHLLPLILLRRYQISGHKAIALVGGATGLIGDPSGKADERGLNDPGIVKEWGLRFKNQIKRFLDFDGPNPAMIVNNIDWIEGLDVIHFLRDIGKNFSVPQMLARESVKMRLESGISFTEFSYMVLQAYDFLKLNELHDCVLQIGGSEQWGNITAGIDLVRRIRQKSVWGLTMPLLLRSDGKKMGKTEAGALWLDEKKTSGYQFYQYWLNVDDADAVKLLMYFTFIPVVEIHDLQNQHKNDPGKRMAQIRLAEELTTLVHGKDTLERAKKISHALFYGDIRALNEQEVHEAAQTIPSTNVSETGGINKDLTEIISMEGLSGSKRQAREDLKNGAILINGVKVTDSSKVLGSSDKLFGKFTFIRRGKKNYHVFIW
jgi:tyrosyl-tRNA synthetase